MRKVTTYLILFVLLIMTANLFGNPITLEEATRLAKAAMKRNPITASNRSFTQATISTQFTKKEGGQVAYYAFNFKPKGFVVIAADDRYFPVLAFSDESHLDLENTITNTGLIGTLSAHAQRINYIQEKNLQPTKTIQKEWQLLRKGIPVSTSRNNVIVEPLTTTRWNQGEFYNGECPANDGTVGVGPADRTYCGCIPVAMAQLIKFHDFPAQGNGSHRYTDDTFGVQEEDFCNTIYNWDNMPDELTEPNSDVAQLIYQMGVSTNTDYSVSYTSTYFSYVRNAYVNYFGYDNAAKWFYDANFDQFAVVAKDNLDRGLPVMLTGSTTNAGHAWVADGYASFGENGTADYFHFNWGWGGSNNGWFLDSGTSWYPTEGQDEGVQEIIYYWERYVLYDLYPADSPCQAPTSNSVYAEGMTDKSTYIYLSNNLLDQDINFRYREKGNTEWTVTNVTSDYYQYIGNLDADTEYEFQARRKCCSEDWSEYSSIETFTTTGERESPEPPTETCTPLLAENLTTSNITETFAYIYTSRPYGSVNNTFRYRAAGEIAWIDLPTSINHYRALSNLQSGQAYEFQVNHECSEGVWSGFSASQSFMTEGLITCTAVFFADTDGDGYGDENNTVSGCSPPQGYVNNADDCDDNDSNIPATPGSPCTNGVIDTDGCTCKVSQSNNCSSVSPELLDVSHISATGLYVYTYRPYGIASNQFRYRPVGSGEWMYSEERTDYYRYISDLNASTTYEYQVRHECPNGGWSDYSDSSEFTTSSSFQSDNSSTSPINYAAFRQLSNEPTISTFQAFPNPASNYILFQLEKAPTQDASLNIYDIQGRFLRKEIIPTDQVQTRINISHLDTGVYWLEYKTSSESKTMKLVKQ